MAVTVPGYLYRAVRLIHLILGVTTPVLPKLLVTPTVELVGIARQPVEAFGLVSCLDNLGRNRGEYFFSFCS